MRTCVVLLLLAVLAGCTKAGRIVPYGQDTYIINVDNMLGNRSNNYLQVKAAERANAFCDMRGKTMRVQSAAAGVQSAPAASAPPSASTSASLVFSCVDKK